jgi:hypothetical protein
MIRTGQTIENPVTGERLIFHQTSRGTDGEYVLVEAILQPNAVVASAHVHPYQSSPALEFEQLIETMFGLAADGRTSKKGMPNALRLAVIARHHFDDVRLPVIPHILQRAALAMGAPVGRALGYRPVYEPAGAAEAAVA